MLPSVDRDAAVNFNGAQEVDVTVIVAVKNGGSTVRQCIESVLLQRDCSLQLVIVDALSSDETPQIVSSLRDSRIVYLRDRDQGICDAWNRALRVTLGEWCIFLGADDYFLDEMSLRRLLTCTTETTEGREPVAIVFGGIHIMDGDTRQWVSHPDDPDPFRYLMRGRMLPHPGMLSNVRALREVGGFDASLHIAGDFDASVRVAKLGAIIRCPAEVTAMRLGGLSTSRRFRRQMHRERYRILRRELGAVSASGIWCGEAVRRLGEATLWFALTRTLGERRAQQVDARIRVVLRRPRATLRWDGTPVKRGP
jgi:glycosyltransferase involved in cell wall biosynthesis